MKFLNFFKISILFIFLNSVFIPVQANEAPHVLLHVTTSSKIAHQVALSNANALLKTYGKENIIIEIVANGPGVAIANSKNSLRGKVASLLDEGVRLSVCNASINMMKKQGKKISLVNGSVHVSNGISRVVELQQKGYIYVRP